MFVGIENDSTRDEPETTPELTGTPLAKTESMADFLVGLPQCRSGSPRCSPGEAPVCSGIARCRPGLRRIIIPCLSQSSPDNNTVCHGVARFNPVFDISPGSSRFY